MQIKDIVIKGAREHNLKNIDVTIPRNSLTVITGLSGSGKSSLAFDTLYSEGQRRYVESLSAYARQFLGLMEKPDVDSIEGLSPAISIEQKITGHNPRSTVGTITEIHDYLRLLFRADRRRHLLQMRHAITRRPCRKSPTSLDLPAGTKFQILVARGFGPQGRIQGPFEKLRKTASCGSVDKMVYSLDDDIKLDKNKKHYHRGRGRPAGYPAPQSGGLTESLETALKLSANGTVLHRSIGRKPWCFRSGCLPALRHQLRRAFAAHVFL